MARTFPTVGQSPIDAYTTGKVPASYFEFAGTVTADEEWHGNEIVASPVLGAGSSFVGQTIVITPTGLSGTWVSGSYIKVAFNPATLASHGYVSAAEFEVAISGTLQACDFGVIVLDGNNANTYASQPRGAYIMINDFGATEIPNLFRLMGLTTGNDNDTTSLFAATTAPTITHTIKIMGGTNGLTPYWIPCCAAQST